MLNWNLLQQLLIVAIALSNITSMFVQKTKGIFPSKWIPFYSFTVNMLLSFVFCLTFTEASIYHSLWVGLFAFLGADTLYKTLTTQKNDYQEQTKKVENDYTEIEVDR